MGASASGCSVVDVYLLANINRQIHPGEVKYYNEIGIALIAAQQ